MLIRQETVKQKSLDVIPMAMFLQGPQYFPRPKGQKYRPPPKINLEECGQNK